MSNFIKNAMKLKRNLAESKKPVVLMLTPLGKQKAEKFDLPGAKSQVITILNDDGPSTVNEIANACGMPYNKAKDVCKSLMRDGYARKANASGD